MSNHYHYNNYASTIVKDCVLKITLRVNYLSYTLGQRVRTASPFLLSHYIPLNGVGHQFSRFDTVNFMSLDRKHQV